MSEYIVDGAEPNSTVLKSTTPNGYEHEKWLPVREEIVRCRDCVKWHHIDTLDGVRYGECDEWKRADSYCVPATRENGFCAWATCKCGEDIETSGRESVTCPSCGRVITE